MEGYTYTEIGMLAGTVIGGMLAIAEFVFWDSFPPLVCVVLGVCLGSFTGKLMDKKSKK